MISKFEQYIETMFLEADQPEQDSPDSLETSGNAPEDASADEAPVEEPPPEVVEKDVFPEELELAKLAIRALYFNIASKDVHNLKLRVTTDNSKIEIPFEKISDYFEKTKRNFPILGFVEWAMDRYEGISSKWTEQPEIRGRSIVEKIKMFNKSLPEDKRLDNGKRVYWTRIVLNCLLRGSANFNINIADVNERNIKEIFRLLSQHFGTDTRGILSSINDIQGPGTF